MRMILIVALAAALTHPLSLHGSESEAFARQTDQYIEETLALLPAIPGLTITVVRGGSPVYVRGFGWADAEARRAMTAETAIYIASNTKPFTALAAAFLERESLLDLDAPVKQYLPCAPFPPDIDPSAVTLKNLLTHTSGLVNDPIVFRTAFSGDYGRSDLHRLLRFTTPNESAPRGSFHYTNTGYNVLGFVMEEITGSDWQDLLHSRIFAPLAMNDTSARVSELGAGRVPAAPYRATGRSSRVPIPSKKTDRTLHAAGGIFTTAADLARWLAAQTDPDSAPFPPEAILETQRLQASSKGTVGPFQRDGYGLGWIVGSHGGERMLYHLGTFPGANSLISFMPDRDLGVAVFVNEDIVGMRVALLLTAFAYDLLLQRDAKPLNEFRSGIALRLDEAKPLPPPVRFTAEQAAPLRGRYESYKYGTLIVTLTDEKELRFTIGEQQAAATSFENGVASVPFRPGRPESFAFVADDGRALRVDYGEWGAFHRVE